jgi:hypothetical protein
MKLSSIIEVAFLITILFVFGESEVSLGQTACSNAAQYRGQNGQQFACVCPANFGLGGVWGAGVYTDDSSICTAALHAGILTQASGGTVTIEIRPGQSSYTSSSQNGVTTTAYGSWHGSFVFVGSTSPQQPGMEYNVDRLGGDFTSFDLTDARPEVCQNACAGDGRCVAWTYVKPGVQGPYARCWLKSVVPNPVANTCCVSGVKATQPASRMEYDVDRLGGDFTSFDLSDARPEVCQNACAGDGRCVAWTYVKPGVQGPYARCWLKSVVPNPIANTCCVSGVK